MKKFLIAIFAVIALSSCQKEEVIQDNQQEKLFIQVEVVDVDGVKSQSNIVSVK